MSLRWNYFCKFVKCPFYKILTLCTAMIALMRAFEWYLYSKIAPYILPDTPFKELIHKNIKTRFANLGLKQTFGGANHDSRKLRQPKKHFNFLFINYHNSLLKGVFSGNFLSWCKRSLQTRRYLFLSETSAGFQTNFLFGCYLEISKTRHIPNKRNV